MENAVLKESLTRAQKNMMAYMQNRDVQYIAEDAVYRQMSTGEEYRGRAEIGGLLHFMYYVAFDATVEIKSYIITEEKAMFDGFFTGSHIGEINGIPPTQKHVRVPLSVSYDLKDGLIKEARIFMLADVLQQQLGVAPDASGQKTNFVTRDVFRLKYGHFKEVKALLEDAAKKDLMPGGKNQRVLSDFTGEAYRLVLEEGFDSLSDYEKTLTSGMHKAEWQQWYEQFKPHVESGYREILRQVL
ncbi:MAG TPA: ester cyclase [Chitinophagaceae bacterium]|nr:ester cyclase [Chitinophagaceae bacterium]